MADFTEAIDNFIEEESDAAGMALRDPDDAEIDRLETILDGRGDTSVYRDVLKRQKSSYSILADIKQDVLNDIQGERGGDHFLSALMKSILAISIIALQGIDEVKQQSDSMAAIVGFAPPKTEDEEIKALLDSVIEKSSRLNTTISTLETNVDRAPDKEERLRADLSERIGREIFDVGDIFDAILEGPAEQTNVIQVVTELRDDFYKITRPQVDRNLEAVTITTSKEIILTDSDGNKIDSVSGFEGFEILDDGTIRLAGLKGGLNAYVDIDLTVSTDGTPSPKRSGPRRTDVAENLRQAIQEEASNLEDKLAFEIWACLILDIASSIKAKWDKIKNSLKQAIQIFKIKKNIVNGYPFAKIPPIGQTLLGGSNGIKSNLDKILDPSNTAINLLGVRSSFINGGDLGSGGGSLCEFNHEKYCNINKLLSDMIRDLFADLDRIALRIKEFDLEFDFEDMIDFLNKPFEFLDRQINKIDETVAKLEKDICAYVTRRMSGRPKSMVDFEVLLLGLIPSLLLIGGASTPSRWGAEDSDVIPNSIIKLRKFGYNEAATSLEMGDLDAFFAYEPQTATSAGSAAKLVSDEVSKTDDDRKRFRLQKLAIALNDAGAYQKASSVTRETMINRLRNHKQLNVFRAQQLKAEGEALLA